MSWVWLVTLPQISVAWYVRAMSYLFTHVPGVITSASCVMVTTPEQLSVALTAPSLATGTSALQATAAFAGNTVMIGLMLSLTWMSWVWLVTLPQMSVAWYVRAMSYLFTQLPGVITSASCVMVITPEQLSVAVTEPSSAFGTSDEHATAAFAGNTVISGL